MSRMFFIMHHIALCTPFIALVNAGHLLHMRVDHAEPKSKIQAVQVQREAQRSTSDKLRGC
jgi:hypothetical protein